MLSQSVSVIYFLDRGGGGSQSVPLGDIKELRLALSHDAPRSVPPKGWMVELTAPAIAAPAQVEPHAAHAVPLDVPARARRPRLAKALCVSKAHLPSVLVPEHAFCSVSALAFGPEFT